MVLITSDSKILAKLISDVQIFLTARTLLIRFWLVLKNCEND